MFIYVYLYILNGCQILFVTVMHFILPLRPQLELNILK